MFTCDLYAEIIIDISHDNVDNVFTYIVPENLRDKVYPGCPIVIPFGKANSKRNGYIINIINTTEVPLDKLKAILEISQETVSAKAELIKLAAWMKIHYGCTMNRALKTVLPVKNKVSAYIEKKVVLNISNDMLSQVIDTCIIKNRKAWLRIIYALRDNGRMNYSKLCHDFGATSVLINRLEKEGIISTTDISSYRNPFKEDEVYGVKHLLHQEQKNCVDIFNKDYDEAINKTYLLYGITGSGKTQVYIEMIRKVLSKNKKVILLIPEISLTYQTVNRVLYEFQGKVALIHSKLSSGERYDQFLRTENGDADIIIGPRSAIFAPFDGLGLIIIDEENDGAYKNENTPRYLVHDIAQKRAEFEGASVVLASATPSPDSYKKAIEGMYTLLKLTKRASSESELATTHVIDLREELKSGNRSIFSRYLLNMIEDRLSKHQQIILFINRRGYSNFVSCRSCGNAIMCPHCDVSLTLHKEGTLVCHYCGYTIDVPKLCPSCSSPYIAGFGVGTQKLEIFTKKIFPKARVLRLDMDTSSRKNGATRVLKQFSEGGADILIGTQMVVKGHDFPNVSLVGIVAADISLYVNDYTSSQKTFELITQAAGRAGRGNIKGDVVIQTYKPEHYAIACAAAQDYETFYNKELTFRKITGYPPAIHIWTVQLSSMDEKQLALAADFFTATVENYSIEYKASIIGPVKASVYKIHDYYRKMLYIKHYDYDILLKIKDKTEIYCKNTKRLTDISVLYDFT